MKEDQVLLSKDAVNQIRMLARRNQNTKELYRRLATILEETISNYEEIINLIHKAKKDYSPTGQVWINADLIFTFLEKIGDMENGKDDARTI